MLFTTALVSTALAQSVPTRQIPSSVLVELQRLQSDFELALAADCDAERCFPTGCVYVDHAVADQPREGSLPGLGLDPGPGSVAPQEYLTRAQCAFAHEPSLEAEDAQALVRRLQTKLTSGWTVVSVVRRELLPLSTYVGEPPPIEEDPVEPVDDEPEDRAPLEPGTAGQQLWSTLLPHTPWMVGIALVTLALSLLSWAYRRLGATTMEERMLLAELERGDAPPAATEDTAPSDDGDNSAWVAAQDMAWSARLANEGDPELRALTRELLRSGDQALLAKAALHFPDSFFDSFPSGADVAGAKLALADYVKGVDEATLPDDVAFFEALNRHAAAAAITVQDDAELMRRLQQDYGAAGLATLVRGLAPRLGGLVFALSPATAQHEVVRLLSARQSWALADQLLRSNRLDPAEAAAVFAVLQGEAVAQPAEVSDRGAPFDAVGALCVLLPALDEATQSALFSAAISRAGGRLPAWTRGLLLPEMLAAIPEEARADLLLEVEVEALAAWLSLTAGEARSRVLASMPGALRSSVAASSVFPSRTRQLALAAEGRAQLARGFVNQLARAGLSFEQALVREPA